MKSYKITVIWLVINLLLHKINCCPDGTYYSYDLDGCLDCPGSLKYCHGEHQRDICSCFKNCPKDNLGKGITVLLKI